MTPEQTGITETQNYFLKWHDSCNDPLKDSVLMPLATSVWGHAVSFLMNAGSEHKSLCLVLKKEKRQ